MARALRPRVAAAGDAIFKEGDPSDGLYLVDEGHVQVTRGGEVLAVLGPGSFVGELGLLLDEARTADLEALTDVNLLFLPRDVVDEMLREHPHLAVELSRELGSRLAATTRRLAPTATVPTTAVWGDGRLEAFLDEVEDLIGERPPVVGPEDVDTAATTAAHVVVLIPRSERPDRATRSVLRRAEYVVTFLAPPPWLVRRTDAHRLLRCDGSMSLERAARWVSGKSVGLALSSGGSKTVAHIGVHMALRHGQVPIDVLAGASGGALVAASIAAGHGLPTMKRNLNELSELLSFRRWDLNVPPRTGAMKGRRLRETFDRWFEGRTLEDLSIPVVVVATDLGNGELVVIESGSVADAVRASLSIPGVFDPWSVQGRLMIDGAVVDPLPTGVLRDRGAAVVIASNVAGREPDGLAGLDSKPGVVQTMLRMINVSERELLKSRLPLADLVIRPDVVANYSFDFTRIEDFVAAGEDAARAALQSVAREGRVLFP